MSLADQTRLERINRQLRVEYILPAFFDESVTVPGILTTTGRISLAKRTSDDLAALIVTKLEEAGVSFSSTFAYSDEAKADVDIPRPNGKRFSHLIEAMRTYTWSVQAPAVNAVLRLEWDDFTKDQIFVLGRNLYQCADGSERGAVEILHNVRARLAQVPLEAALHLLNGMFYEVYFNSEGVFRERSLKGRHLEHLLKLQAVTKFAPSIGFIRKALLPYARLLPILPSYTPEPADFVMVIRKSDPPVVKSLRLRGTELISLSEDDAECVSDVWKLSFVQFTVERLKKRLAEAWSIPPDQLHLTCKQQMEADAKYRLPADSIIKWPRDGVPPLPETEVS